METQKTGMVVSFKNKAGDIVQKNPFASSGMPEKSSTANCINIIEVAKSEYVGHEFDELIVQESALDKLADLNIKALGSTFWSAWKRRKEEIKNSGIYVRKEFGVFVVTTEKPEPVFMYRRARHPLEMGREERHCYNEALRERVRDGACY